MNEQPFTIETRSPEETEALGYVLATLIPIGSVIALRGELATGKTCLVRGMANHFAQNETVTSPTFTIVNQYGNSPCLYHIDLYRLDIEEVIDLGYEELFEPDGITVIEWAERAEGLVPQKRLDIFLAHAGQDHRKLTFHNHNVLPNDWKKTFSDSLNSDNEKA